MSKIIFWRGKSGKNSHKNSHSVSVTSRGVRVNSVSVSTVSTVSIGVNTVSVSVSSVSSVSVVG